MPPGRAVNQRRAAEENELDWRIKDISYDEADPIFYIYPDEDQEEVVEFVFDDQSFAEEDSYFSGEQYFQSKIVEPVTTSDDPLGLVYDEDAKEANAVWEAIDKMMDSQRKDRREARLKKEIKKYCASNQQMRTRMSNVSIEPITAAEYFKSEFFPIIRSNAWANIGFRSSMKDVYVCIDNFISGLLGRIRRRILSTQERMMRQKM
ncbi:hypothetical protein CRG98_040555 [Punica granatum]|uniref:PRP1 splicing factor N-terminal domain-containing protein n=1 Tax=Punica granatum TaxID=22663 RepID=A0A2I0I513_PUNGR|nr:hypothetical protein CRG98_040555 [Punica granatum]